MLRALFIAVAAGLALANARTLIGSAKRRLPELKEDLNRWEDEGGAPASGATSVGSQTISPSATIHASRS